MLFGAISLSATACKTGTVLDAIAYPSEPYSQLVSDDPDGLSLCQALEKQGYTFDEFSVEELGVQVMYPDGTSVRFRQDYGITPLVLTPIARDFDGVAALKDGEEERLWDEAVSFCRAYEQAATELAVDLPLHGIFFWDFTVGMRVGFYFSDTGCEITGGFGWSAGSYARDYELDPEATCPSGHVVQ
jgi:hypothetical protein